MGNVLCQVQASTIRSMHLSQKIQQKQPTKVEFQESVQDSIEIQQGPTALKSFINLHKNKQPICASNRLQFQSNKQNIQKVQQQSLNILQFPIPKAMKKNANAYKRCSIQVQAPDNIKQAMKGMIYDSGQILQQSSNRIEISQQRFIVLRKQNIKKYYIYDQIIGQGSYGCVYNAVCLKTKEKRAIKIIKKCKLEYNKKMQIFAELQLLKKMDHPNIIRLYEVFESENNYQIVMQYCKGGSIIDFIKRRKTFDQNIIKVILKQLLGCLNYLHSLKIVHRDIKLENIVLIDKIRDQTTAQNVEIKLIDFGTAYKMNKPKTKCNSLVGTVSYIAPEIIRGYFTDKCDLWSCGVIMYILFSSKSPFRCKQKQQTLNKILTHDIKFEESIWYQVTMNGKDLLLKLLQKDPARRISAEKALKHPWFITSKQIVKPKDNIFVKNLQNYYRQNNLISVIQSYLIFSKVGQQQRKKINNIFKQYDKNSNGYIQKNQLISAFKQYKHFEEYSESEIEYILNKVDKDKSGCINLSQFSSVMVNRQKLFVKNALQEAFDYFDTDGTGFIEKNQLNKLLQGSQIKQMDLILKQIDSDKDKKISKEQFLRYFLAKGCLY